MTPRLRLNSHKRFQLSLLYEAVYKPGTHEMSLMGERIPSLSLTFELREKDGICKLIAPLESNEPHTGFTFNDSHLGNY
jgi:hypothetical protein